MQITCGLFIKNPLVKFTIPTSPLVLRYKITHLCRLCIFLFIAYIFTLFTTTLFIFPTNYYRQPVPFRTNTSIVNSTLYLLYFPLGTLTDSFSKVCLLFVPNPVPPNLETYNILSFFRENKDLLISKNFSFSLSFRDKKP